MLEHYPEQSNLLFDASGSPFLDRGVGDRFITKMYRNLYSDGVMPQFLDSFKVNATTSGMEIEIKTGIGIVNGRIVSNDEIALLTLDAGTSIERTDLIVLRYSKIDRNFTYEIKKSSIELIREGDIYEVALATIKINRNQTVLNESNITDIRLESEYFGICTPFYNINVDGVFSQFENYLNEQIEQWEFRNNEFEAYMTERKELWTSNQQQILDSAHFIETLSFSKVNKDFDDLSTKRGCTLISNFNKNENGDLTNIESKIVETNDNENIIATRETIFNYNEDSNIDLVESVINFSDYEITDGNITIIFPDVGFKYITTMQYELNDIIKIETRIE